MGMKDLVSTDQKDPPTKRNMVKEWLKERLGLEGLAYPVPKHANSLPYLLGGITLIGFVILIITGIYLAQFYNPDPSLAHQSVVYIITKAPIGDIVRSIHFWTAQIVMITLLLHMLRILFTAAYKRPREVNWYVGLGLLAVTFGLIFTGSVLKFDQEGVEALAHAKDAGSVLGKIGAWFSADFSRSVPLLTRLFNAHTTILPLFFVLLIGVHVYLIKQHGISPQVTEDAVAHSTAGEGTSRFDIHLRKMLGYGLLLFALILLLSLFIPAPLGQPGVAGVEITKPWWMFIWLFPAEEALGSRALVIVPLVLGIILALVPVLDRSPYLNPRRRNLTVALSGIGLLAIAVSGIIATIQPVTNHLMK